MGTQVVETIIQQYQVSPGTNYSTHIAVDISNIYGHGYDVVVVQVVGMKTVRVPEPPKRWIKRKVTTR